MRQKNKNFKNRKKHSTAPHQERGKTARQSPQRNKAERRSRTPDTQQGNPALLYGVHAVTEAILNPKRSIHRILATKNAEQTLTDVLQHSTDAGLKRPDVSWMKKEELEDMLPPHAVHQGMVVDAAPLNTPKLDDLLKTAKLIVMLDHVTDPHNVGAILRSASAFGADAIITQDRHAPEITGILAKIACGAVEHTPILKEVNLSRTIKTCQEAGFTCIGLDERGKITLAELTKPDKAVLVMGAEGDGLRRLVAEKCDILTRLPTQGRIASLNVSNAAAVSLYELVR